jgi:WD40 repeat protein
MMNVRMLLFLSIVLIECTYIAMEKPDVEDCINDTLRKKIGLLGLKDSNTQELIPSDIQRRIASCMIMDFLCDTALEIRESCPLTIDNNPENTFDMIAMSDDDTIVVGAEVRTLDIAYIWNMQGTLLHTLKGHNDVIKEIILSHENKYIVTLSNGSIKIWDRTTGRIRHTLNPCVSYINSMHITPDDKQLVTVLLREEGLNIIEIWDIEEGKSLLQFPIFDHHCIASLLMRYKNKQIITLSCRASLKLWDVVTGTLIRTLKDRGKNNTVIPGKLLVQESKDNLFK